MRRATLTGWCYIHNIWISIHALREESDSINKNKGGEKSYFNPRSPWGERPDSNSLIVRNISISIHALREESDKFKNNTTKNVCKFQSTLSVRRATKRNLNKSIKDIISIHALREESDIVDLQRKINMEIDISIHALREESDFWLLCRVICQGYFTPRCPWGERQARTPRSNRGVEFQSTLSVRRATSLMLDFAYMIKFQSTLSVRRATLTATAVLIFSFPISIHALREESDLPPSTN